ncbi:MAG: UvrD-helicase domain-containing protein [Hungatella sp.]|nr:UvrD-helicase domain-containing protein [Hungatella sp.]
MYIADLHIHSRYSRATSRECTPEYLDMWARRKGIDLLGTGDFTHPAWRSELEEKLTPAEEGLYQLKEELQLKDYILGKTSPRFVISGEISSIYKKNGRVRKVHNVILLPGLADAKRLSEKLETIGNIHSDGRPILGLDSRDLLEITLEICPRAIFVPAHIWTPHFSMFGAFSGFDTIEECFEDLTPHIHAIETGLSSDPPMNWRLSALDHLQMISNSDAHSPGKLGREANLLDIEMSYDGLYEAIQRGKGLAGTIEFFPEEGKYHFDGHRKCHLCLSPREAEKYGGECPVCHKKLTLGVSHRIQQLADREEGYKRADGRPFESLVPLPEVIAASTGYSAASMKVQKKYEDMVKSLGPEFDILRLISPEDIKRKAGYLVAEGIWRLRQGKVQRFPGFDGEYGTIKLFEPSELESMDGQMSMFRRADIGPGGQDETKAETGLKVRERQEGDMNSQTVHGDIKEAAKPGKSIDMEPNEKQLEAIESIAPRLAVIAGPGTGKTGTLVSRILCLLERRKVKPSEITAVTFTNKAAQEMRSRLEERMGGRKAVKNMQIATFHSISHELLKQQGESFVLADEGEVMEIVREAAEELGIKGNVGKLRQAISERRTHMDKDHDLADEGSFSSSELDQAVKIYEERLAAMNAVDFDDLLLRALELSGRQSKRFSYLLVDEFQDISPLQYQLIQAWSKGGREVFIIGDPNQAIYGFRGAKFGSFHQFCEEQKAEIIRLDQNYRSTPEILTLSQQVLGGNGDTLKPVKGPGFPVRLVQAQGEMSEAIFVAKEINRLVGGIDMLDAQAGFFTPDTRQTRSFADIAVLYRTHRQTELLEKCLKKEGIPYVVVGKEEFLEADTVRGSLGFFKSVLNTGDCLSRRLCLRLLWKLEENEVSQCVYETLAEKYRKLCKKGKPQTIWQSWRDDMGLLDDKDMEKLSGMAVFYKTMGEMIEAVAFGKESDLKRCGGKTYTSDSVTLMTMHGSKGLEFPAVLLYGVRKGMVPLEFKGKNRDADEERRVLYVGMTRAKEELIITTSGDMSEFLERVPDAMLEKETAQQKNSAWNNGRQMSLFDFMS